MPTNTPEGLPTEVDSLRLVIERLLPYAERQLPEPTCHPDWYTIKDQEVIADVKLARAALEAWKVGRNG